MTSKKLNTEIIVRFLKKSDLHYLKQYFSGGSMYDDEGNEVGDFTQNMLDKLLKNGIIKRVGTSEEFWSQGYYKLAQ